jgi:hypothetical protein
MGWTSQVFTSIIIDESTTTGGFFIYSGTPAPGNAPVLSITQAPTDPYGNTVTPSLSLSGLPLLVYSGPPANGNLICSMAPAADTDEFGNHYPEGFGLSVGEIPGGLINAGSIPSTAVDFTATSIGGITTYTQGTQPSGANAGSLWIDTSSGNAIYQYDGSSWSLYQFGSGSIAVASISAAQIVANTITATQIASGTITATQIASGIVLAGVVNGTLIEGAEFVAYGSTGEILVYSGTPASGNLIASISGAAGTDANSNHYPMGIAAFVNPVSGDAYRVTLQDSANLECQIGFQDITNNWFAEPFVGVQGTGGGSAQGCNMVVSGGQSTSGATSAYISLADSVWVTTEGLGSGSLINLAGQDILTGGPVYITDASTGAAETWHYAGTTGNPNFGSGWSNRGSPWVPLAWRMIASPPNCVQIEGWVSSASTDPQLITLPTAYTPTHRQTIVGYDGTANAAVQWNILESGLVELATATAVNGDNYFISGIISLDL